MLAYLTARDESVEAALRRDTGRQVQHGRAHDVASGRILDRYGRPRRRTNISSFAQRCDPAKTGQFEAGGVQAATLEHVHQGGEIGQALVQHHGPAGLLAHAAAFTRGGARLFQVNIDVPQVGGEPDGLVLR